MCGFTCSCEELGSTIDGTAIVIILVHRCLTWFLRSHHETDWISNQHDQTKQKTIDAQESIAKSSDFRGTKTFAGGWVIVNGGAPFGSMLLNGETSLVSWVSADCWPLKLYSSLTVGKVGRHLCFLMINPAFKIMKSGLAAYNISWHFGSRVGSESFDWLLVGRIGRKIFSKMPLRPLCWNSNLNSILVLWPCSGWIQLTHMFPSVGSPVPLDLCKTGPYGTYRTGVETQVVPSLVSVTVIVRWLVPKTRHRTFVVVKMRWNTGKRISISARDTKQKHVRECQLLWLEWLQNLEHLKTSSGKVWMENVRG